MTNIQLDGNFMTRHGQASYGSLGKGPDVILSHGTPTSSFIWKDVVLRLADHYRFHFMDLPGYGKSSKFSGQDVRLRAFAQSVADFAKHLGLKSPHIVGHDFGAAAVLGAVLVEGLEVSSITIADGVVLSPWGTPFSRHVKEHETVFNAVPEYVHRAVIEAHLKTAMSRIPQPRTLSALVEPWLGAQGQAAYYRQVGQYDYDYTSTLESLYPSLRAPVTVLWGEEDRWVDIGEGRRFSAMVRGARFVVLPDAGHFSMLDTPGQFSQSLLQALRQ